MAVSGIKVCVACGVRIGGSYANQQCMQEPNGQEIVCVSCYHSLRRRGVAVSTVREVERKRPRKNRCLL
jgi:hypothetical protein